MAIKKRGFAINHFTLNCVNYQPKHASPIHIMLWVIFHCFWTLFKKYYRFKYCSFEILSSRRSCALLMHGFASYVTTISKNWAQFQAGFLLLIVRNLETIFPQSFLIKLLSTLTFTLRILCGFLQFQKSNELFTDCQIDLDYRHFHSFLT